MKILVLGLFCAFTIQAMAITPPNQNIIDQYVQIALSTSAKELKGNESRSKWACHFPIIHESFGYNYSNDINEATQRLQLSCIKNQCEGLIDEVIQKEEEIQNMSDSDYRDFLEFMGKSQIEIAEMLQMRKNQTTSGPRLNCNNSAHFRMMAFDSCFTVAVECKRNR